MTLQQAMEVSKKAKVLGYAVAVKCGKLQFRTVTFNTNGTSNITSITGWMTHREALLMVQKR